MVSCVASCNALLAYHHDPHLTLLPASDNPTQSKDNDGSQKISGEKLGDFYKELAREFPIVSIEDPFDQVKRTSD